MTRRQRNQWRLHEAALRGKFARKLGLKVASTPFRSRQGFGRQLAEAWADGWAEQDRDMRLEQRLKAWPKE